MIIVTRETESWRKLAALKKMIGHDVFYKTYQKIYAQAAESGDYKLMKKIKDCEYQHAKVTRGIF